MSFTLSTVAAQISSITSTKVMVSSALLFCFTIHFVFMGVTHFLRNKVRIERLYDHGRRLVVYGIAALISMNFLENSVMFPIMAWVTLLCVLLMHCMAIVKDIREVYQNVVVAVYYGLVSLWLAGILFFFLFNALQN